MFFFFKQKTAYEMRISDWSSDVCSSDLDEVVNGFRFRYGAFSQDLGFTADLYAFGKIIGGGLPVGALAGPTQYLDWLERHAEVFHSGTFAAKDRKSVV